LSALNDTEAKKWSEGYGFNDIIDPVIVQGNAVKAYAFLGTNSSMANFSSSYNEWKFDLSGLPSTSFPDALQPALTSLLICHVQLTTASAISTVSAGGKLSIDWTPPSTPEDECTSTLCNSTAELLISGWEAQDANIAEWSPLLSKLLLDCPDPVDAEYNMFRAYPAETISSNLDAAFASVMKTYASGYINSTYTMTQRVPGTVEEQRLVLVASRPVWIAMIVLVVLLLTTLFVALAYSDEDRVPFDLEHVLKVLAAEASKGD
jgi:hypothetical protein